MFRSILGLVVLLVGSLALAVDLHVAPAGSDDNVGTASSPLASLEGARDAIRALKANGPLAEPVRVIVADGRYALTEPLTLGPEDTGTPTAPIL